jgi:hypothetical protein
VDRGGCGEGQRRVGLITPNVNAGRHNHDEGMPKLWAKWAHADPVLNLIGPTGRGIVIERHHGL